MRSTAKAAPTVYPRSQRILERYVDQVVKGLKLIVTKRKLTGSKAKTLPDAAAYYQRNRACMRYDTYLAGAAEAGSRTRDAAALRSGSDSADGACDVSLAVAAV